jgi:hypothetical protein
MSGSWCTLERCLAETRCSGPPDPDGQEFWRQFVAKNQIHLLWQQQVFDRGQQPQEILVADLLPFKA